MEGGAFARFVRRYGKFGVLAGIATLLSLIVAVWTGYDQPSFANFMEGMVSPWKNASRSAPHEYRIEQFYVLGGTSPQRQDLEAELLRVSNLNLPGASEALDAESGGIGSVIPEQGDHRFRGKPIMDSGGSGS